MALLLIQNLTDKPVHLGDFYTAVQPHGCIRTSRPVSYLSRLPSVKRALASSSIAVGIALAAGEQFPEGTVNPFEARK